MTVGFAAIQTAPIRGQQVIATSGDALAGHLRDLGAEVTDTAEGCSSEFAKVPAKGRFSVPVAKTFAIIGAPRSTSA